MFSVSAVGFSVFRNSWPVNVRRWWTESACGSSSETWRKQKFSQSCTAQYAINGFIFWRVCNFCQQTQLRHHSCNWNMAEKWSEPAGVCKDWRLQHALQQQRRKTRWRCRTLYQRLHQIQNAGRYHAIRSRPWTSMGRDWREKQTLKKFDMCCLST